MPKHNIASAQVVPCYSKQKINDFDHFNSVHLVEQLILHKKKKKNYPCLTNEGLFLFFSLMKDFPLLLTTVLKLYNQNHSICCLMQEELYTYYICTTMVAAGICLWKNKNKNKTNKNKTKQAHSSSRTWAVLHCHISWRSSKTEPHNTPNIYTHDFLNKNCKNKSNNMNCLS